MAVVALGLAGCVAASPSAGLGLQATTSAAPASASASGSPQGSPSDTPDLFNGYNAGPTYPFMTDSPTATPYGVPTMKPGSIPTAPAGAWSSIHWSYLGKPSWIGDQTSFQVFGWSKGYVGFSLSPSASSGDEPTDPKVVPLYSNDGVHWNQGKALATEAAGTHGQLMEIRSVIEGPGGLLAVGWSGGCASEYLDGLWASSDGMTWRPVNIQKAFGSDAIGRIAFVSGGSAGYTAVAYHGSAVWTSADGTTWHSVTLTGSAFANSKVNDATAFAGGYVLAGAHGTGDCGVSVGPQPTPIPLVASAWWSADSSTWTRVDMPGAASTSDWQNIWLCRPSDKAVIMIDDSESARSAWVSTDGRKWTSVKLPAGFGAADVLTEGSHGLVFGSASASGEAGPLTVRTFNNEYAVVAVRQDGTQPSLAYESSGGAMFGSYGRVAVGPTGIVVSDGASLWIGLPS